MAFKDLKNVPSYPPVVTEPIFAIFFLRIDAKGL
jgi:hypothetical protein